MRSGVAAWGLRRGVTLERRFMVMTIRFATARDLFETFPTARNDISAAPADVGSIAFVHALAKSATPEDAITFCAYLLDPRQAVWWAHECVRAACGPLADEDTAFLALAEAWVRSPDEVGRRAALAAAETVRVRTPATWVVMAAGWSPAFGAASTVTAPMPGSLQRAVNSGVLGALAKVQQESRQVALGRFIEMGLQLAGTGGEGARR